MYNKTDIIKIRDDASTLHFIPFDKICDINIFKKYYAQEDSYEYRIEIYLLNNKKIRSNNIFKDDSKYIISINY